MVGLGRGGDGGGGGGRYRVVEAMVIVTFSRLSIEETDPSAPSFFFFKLTDASVNHPM